MREIKIDRRFRAIVVILAIEKKVNRTLCHLLMVKSYNNAICLLIEKNKWKNLLEEQEMCDVSGPGYCRFSAHVDN
jgi:hypothetical protein